MGRRQPYVYIQPIYKTTWKKNPISGHEWPEYGPVTGYELRGPLGRIVRCKTEEKAEKLREEHEAYWRRNPPLYHWFHRSFYENVMDALTQCRKDQRQ